MNIREIKQKEFGQQLYNYPTDCVALIAPRFGIYGMIFV